MPVHSTPANLRTPPGVILGIIGLSAAASALICWLVYFHAPTDVAGAHLRWLPLVNAVLNALAAIALVTGYREIRECRILHHRASMFFAFLFSSIFLVTYLVNFTLHGETHLHIAHHGALWVSYAIVLFWTHIPLAILALPMILLAHRALPRAQAARALDVSHLALRLGLGRLYLLPASRHPLTCCKDRWRSYHAVILNDAPSS
jgi:putative membrane protein